MEEFGFDVGALLSPEEAERLLDDNQEEKSSTEEDTVKETSLENDSEPAEDEDEAKDDESKVTKSSPEKVGKEKDDDEEKEDASLDDEGSSSSVFYSSIAGALRDDGIFPDFEDSEIEGVKTPEDFAELVEKAISAKFDERQKRINEALSVGVEPDTIRKYEQTLQYLDSIDENVIESADAEDLRKQLIFNDLINRGFTEDRANRSIEKSITAGTDIEDAKDALDSLSKFYREGYRQIQQEAKQEAEAAKAEQKKTVESFRKMVLDDSVKFGDTELDRKTKQRVFDAVSKPVYKDPDTGKMLTLVQKYQKENPLEFLKQMGLWFVLTNGGKSSDAVVKNEVRKAKNNSIRDLERKINTSSFGNDGSMKYAGGDSAKDPLLTDGWKVEM